MVGFADSHLALRLACRLAPPNVFFQYFAAPLACRSWLPKCIHHLRSISREEIVERKKLSSVAAGITILAMTLAPGFLCLAQETAQEPARETQGRAELQRQKADGERRGLPLETYAVAPGTKFLVRLEDEWVPGAQRKTKSSK